MVYPAWIPINITNAMEITTYALSVATTTLSTIIIVTRILLVSRMPGASKQPRLVAEIITESAAPYTISALIYIAMIPGDYYYIDYASAFFAYMAVRPLPFPTSLPVNSSQNFVPVFIMLRVVLGRTRPGTDWSSKISGLEFRSNPAVGAGAQVSPDKSRSHGSSDGHGTNTILTAPQRHLEHDVDIEARDCISDEDLVLGKENLGTTLSVKEPVENV
jgi:hypothetical protein